MKSLKEFLTENLEKPTITNVKENNEKRLDETKTEEIAEETVDHETEK